LLTAVLLCTAQGNGLSDAAVQQSFSLKADGVREEGLGRGSPHSLHVFSQFFPGEEDDFARFQIRCSGLIAHGIAEKSLIIKGEQLVAQLSKNKVETEHGAAPQQISAADIPLILYKPGKNLPVSANLSGNKAEGIAGSGRNSVDRGKIQFFP